MKCSYIKSGSLYWLVISSVFVLHHCALCCIDTVNTQDENKLPWHKENNPWAKDAGQWTNIALGFHIDEELPQHPNQGPLYQRLAALIAWEYRIQGIASFPIEITLWESREGDNPQVEGSLLLSVALKLRYYISDINVFAQAGLGSGINIGLPLNFPYGGGVEMPLSEHLRTSLQLRKGLWVGGGKSLFFLFQLNVSK